MNSIAGYLWKRPDALYGQRGIAFDYIVAGNGVFVEAQNDHIAARAPVAACSIRGLAPVEPKVVLRHGRIPARLWELTLNAFLATPDKEMYIGVRWNGSEYSLYTPHQTAGAAHIEYLVGDGIVLDLHSHGGMRAFFSGTDDKDEQGLRLYGVIGRLDSAIQFRIRAGVYGYFHPVKFNEVFDNATPECDLNDTQVCRVCGCSEFDACEMPDGNGCSWVEPGLCSACAEKIGQKDRRRITHESSS